MSKAGEIEYNSIKILFERAWNSFSAPKMQHQAVTRSAAKIRETLNFANQDLVSAGRDRLSAQEVLELLEWYDYVRGGLSYTFLRDRDLGGFWAFEKTLKNNDELAGTFTRTAGDSSNASYIDPSTGLLTFENTLNTPRYSAGKYGHGVIIEGARDNDILNQDLDHADWVKANITVSGDTAEILDKAGGNNADKLTASAANGTATLTTALDVGTDDGAFSVWIAAPTGSIEGEIRITDDSDTVTGTTTFTATQTWQKIQVAYENAGDPSDNWQVVIQIDTDTEIIYVFLPNLEVGADVLFASNTIRGDLGSELMPNQVDRDFSDASAWANVDLDTYDETGDLTIAASAQNQYCTCPVASAPTTIGERYKMTFDVANIVDTWTIKSFDGTQSIGTVSANGAGQDLTWKATTTGGYRIVSDEATSEADFDNFTLQRITSKRNDELLLYAAANVVNNLKGSYGFWFKPEWIYNKHAGAVLLWVDDSGDAARHSSIAALANGNLEFRVYNGAGVAIEVTFSLSGITQDNWHYITCTYDTTISNGLKIYVDSALGATSSNDAFVPEVIGTNIAIGATTAGASESFCVFDEIKIRKDVMSLSQIRSVFNRGRGAGIRRNRWTLALTDPNFNPVWSAGNRYGFLMRGEEVIT